MDDYSNLIFFLVFLALLGLSRVKKWLRVHTGLAGPKSERRAPAYGSDNVGEEVSEYLPVWESAEETNVPPQTSIMPQPGVPETHPGDSKEEGAKAPAGEEPTEIRKAPSSRLSLFRDARDVKRGVIWAEVLRRPVPRRLRRRG
ncbi:MAG: hypothetical protein ACE5JU_15370 [Candidatus Binatia bacterium]